MGNYLQDFLKAMRPAFSRQATFHWFIIVFAGFLVRSDTLGVSSIVRALSLSPESYTSLLHFFHSTAWSVEGLMTLWWQWLAAQQVAYRLGDRLVMIGDHTKVPKDGRKMPAVTTLHQDSETGSKPSFFRGHHWGCISLVVQACGKFRATPLWANIQEGLATLTDDDQARQPKTIRIVSMAQRVAAVMGGKAYLVLDAYFGVGPVFNAAAEVLSDTEQLIHILTRAKKNIVAYHPAPKPKKRKRGPRRKYGKKVKLMTLFDSKAHARQFQTAQAELYGGPERVRYLLLDLLWKPTKSMLRFILVESSRGRMVLMSSDLNLDPLQAMHLYCRRARIETMFDVLKNTLGALAYHFWSLYLHPASRRPKKNDGEPQCSSQPTLTRRTLAATEKFVNVQLLVLGTLQLLARAHPHQVRVTAHCWLRTVTTGTPSEFVTRLALATLIKNNSHGFAKNWITRLIRRRQECPQKRKGYANAA
jgi:hypothetical protein